MSRNGATALRSEALSTHWARGANHVEGHWQEGCWEKRVGRVERGIIEGLAEALAYERGDTSVGRVLTSRRATGVPAPDFAKDRVIGLRRRLGVSQPVFARALNVSDDTVRGWEQGRNAPGGATARA